MEVWVERELDGGAFPDQRLKARLGKLLGDLGQRIGDTVPTACQDWRPFCTKGFDDFVTSTATSAAFRLERPSCRVGLAPTG